MGKQHLERIITNQETDLFIELQALIDNGNFIRAVVQDVQSKNGFEALYAVICEKQFEKIRYKPKPQTKQRYAELKPFSEGI